MHELIGPLKKVFPALNLSVQVLSPLVITQHIVKALDMTRELISIVIVILVNAVCKRCTSINLNVFEVGSAAKELQTPHASLASALVM